MTNRTSQLLCELIGSQNNYVCIHHVRHDTSVSLIPHLIASNGSYLRIKLKLRLWLHAVSVLVGHIEPFGWKTLP